MAQTTHTRSVFKTVNYHIQAEHANAVMAKVWTSMLNSCPNCGKPMEQPILGFLRCKCGVEIWA